MARCKDIFKKDDLINELCIDYLALLRSAICFNTIFTCRKTIDGQMSKNSFSNTGISYTVTPSKYVALLSYVPESVVSSVKICFRSFTHKLFYA